jgi:hypothetical protein
LPLPTPLLPPKEPLPDETRRHHQAEINGVRYQFPVCHLCGRDVEAFTWSDHYPHDSKELLRTFFCMCHGEVEHVSLRIADMQRGDMKHFRIDKAFLPPLLDAAAEEMPALEGRPVPRLTT